MCALHANYLKGNKNKMLKLQEYGFWLATPNDLHINTDTHKHHLRHNNHIIMNNLTNSNLNILVNDTNINNHTSIDPYIHVNIQDLDLAHTHWGGRCNDYTFVNSSIS